MQFISGKVLLEAFKANHSINFNRNCPCCKKHVAAVLSDQKLRPAEVSLRVKTLHADKPLQWHITLAKIPTYEEG